MTPISPQNLDWRFQLIGLDHAAERTAGRELPRAVDAGEKGKLGGDAHEAAELDRLIAHAARGGEVDAEGFFREEVFAGAQDVEVDFLVQVVGHGGVDDIHVGEREQLAVIGGEVFHAGHLPEPVEETGLQVADGDKFGADGKVHEGEPAGEGAGGLAAHQAAAEGEGIRRKGEGRAEKRGGDVRRGASSLRWRWRRRGRRP
jgi:hypothetical protein